MIAKRGSLFISVVYNILSFFELQLRSFFIVQENVLPFIDYCFDSICSHLSLKIPIFFKLDILSVILALIIFLFLHLFFSILDGFFGFSSKSIIPFLVYFIVKESGVQA